VLDVPVTELPMPEDAPADEAPTPKDACGNDPKPKFQQLAMDSRGRPFCSSPEFRSFIALAYLTDPPLSADNTLVRRQGQAAEALVSTWRDVRWCRTLRAYSALENAVAAEPAPRHRLDSLPLWWV